MKKITAILLTALILVSALVILASAESANAAVTFKKLATAPVLDGVVKDGEYGQKIHTVDYDNDEFLDQYDPDHEMDADFYGAWTDEGVYLAWVCRTDVHVATAYDSNMWKYCVIQFVTTPSDPTDVDPDDCNELGICISSEDGQPHKWVYKGPVSIEDWEFNGKRDDAAKTTTYEVFLPWKAMTAGAAGKEGTVVGVSYALGAQEDFNEKNCMVEWQDAILGGKNYPASAVVTLAAGDAAAPAADGAAAATTTTEEAPKTADAGLIAVIAAMAASAGAALSLKKRK